MFFLEANVRELDETHVDHVALAWLLSLPLRHFACHKGMIQ